MNVSSQCYSGINSMSSHDHQLYYQYDNRNRQMLSTQASAVAATASSASATVAGTSTSTSSYLYNNINNSIAVVLQPDNNNEGQIYQNYYPDNQQQHYHHQQQQQQYQHQQSSSHHHSSNYMLHNQINEHGLRGKVHPVPPPLPTWYTPPIMPPEHMINMIHLASSNGREARNRAEKNRRDKLNGSIQELSTMVPHVAESPRRVDKTAVLRFSAHGLRIDYVFGKSIGPCHVRIKPQISESFFKLLDSFLLTVTCRGQIMLISPSIEQHLGHCQTDLFGQNILNITHPDDHSLLKRQLIPTDLETLFDIQHDDDGGEPRQRTQQEEDEIDRKLREDRRDFTVRFARAGPRSEPTAYEVVRMHGFFRRADSAPRGIKTSTLPSGLQLIRRARGRDDGIPLHTISGNDIVLVSRVRVIKTPPICDRLIEASKYEYKTRHLIDGRIVQCDQRISIVAGYLTEEVSGLSPFTFMHKDDVRWVMVALRQMYDFNSPYGESCYRLMTRTGEFIYLKTRGFLEIDKNTNKVHSFCCINTMVTEDEGKKLVREMKKKFSIIINPSELQALESEIPAVENPHQIERAIMNLITNLRNNTLPEDNDSDGSSPAPREIIEEIIETTTFDQNSKTSPYAFIAPEACTIKSSITKSVNVIVAASKGFKTSGDNGNNTTNGNNRTNNSSRPSVLQKNMTYSKTTTNCYMNRQKEAFLTKSSQQNQTVTNAPTTAVAVGDDQLKVEFKTEPGSPQYEESRVPPLPDSNGYFDQQTTTFKGNNNFQIKSNSLSSPPEYIQTDFINDSQSGYEQNSRGSTLNNNNNHHQGSNSSKQRHQTPHNNNSNSSSNSNSSGNSNNSRISTLGGLKRTHSNDNYEEIAKRRNIITNEFTNQNTDVNIVAQENFLTPCIDVLTNPDADLLQVLPSSFDDIDRSLLHIEGATAVLRGQCDTYAVSEHSHQQLNEIMVEHQEQRDMLESIQEEFQARIQDVPIDNNNITTNLQQTSTSHGIRTQYHHHNNSDEKINHKLQPR